jgi:hypothetical protein
MPAWEYLVLRPLKVNGRTLEVGELTVIPNTWTYSVLQAHLYGGLIEKAKLLEDTEYEPQAYPSGVPEGYDDLKPTPPPREGHKVRGEGEKWQACWNCYAHNFLPRDLDRQLPWQCHCCHQGQSLEERDERWQQQSNADRPYESLLGITDHPGPQPRPPMAGSEDLTGSWKSQAPVRS